ncbi:hypothetical protein ANCDUO_05764 [Ancylostoma duodenale]|uniref:Ras-GEF domain-containing protein n=1 Tax=Ancylostoma duodenale TaxID=51022 RepID=A0A0C2DMT7_9BILA|nr:hypothetical protein ANCDUO_05764 [Ancylostoma duodenale]
MSISVTSRSGSSTSTTSAAAGFVLNEEPITLFRLELERLQYILHFPEEVAFQVFNSLRCTLWFQVSSWITHVIVSQPTHDDRKITLVAILRIVETCWNIG